MNIFDIFATEEEDLNLEISETIVSDFCGKLLMYAGITDLFSYYPNKNSSCLQIFLIFCLLISLKLFSRLNLRSALNILCDTDI